MSGQRDEMELKEEAVRAHYAGAAALLSGFDHAPRIARAQVVEQADSEATRRTLRFAMARVYEDKLGDSFEAMGAYKSALESNASDTEALTALESARARR